MTDHYIELKEAAHVFFQNNSIINSLCFGNIRLNSSGFRHLIFKDLKHKRDQKNQIKRFQLLEYVKPILSGMKYYQEYVEHLDAKYFAFIAVLNSNIRIKIIIKQSSNSTPIFWSVIPYWETRHYKGIKFIKLHKGNLIED
mgnify:FL=1